MTITAICLRKNEKKPKYYKETNNEPNNGNLLDLVLILMQFL